MILDATCQLDYQTTEVVPAIFMLRPRSGWAQWIMREEFYIQPQVPVVEFTDVYGNLCQRVVIMPGEFHVSVKYRVQVSDSVDEDFYAQLTYVQNLPPDVLHYLLPSRYCQSDRLPSLADSIVGHLPTTFQRVAEIRTWIHRNIAYVSGSSDSSTSALDTADSRRGVCRDFAHLGIALCRARAGHGAVQKRGVPGLRAPGDRPDAQPEHSRAHGGGLPAPAPSHGPACLVRGLHRRALVHL